MKLDRSNFRPIVLRLKLHVWLACPAALVAPVLFPNAPHANASCESLTSLALPDTAIASVTAVSAGPFAIPDPPPVDPNRKAFRAHGGKLLLYQGWSDPAVAPLNAANYYKNVVAALTGKDERAFEPESDRFFQANGKAEEGLRLFRAPGMSHGGGGPGLYKFDACTPLVNCGIVAHATNHSVDRTRPLCADPMPRNMQATAVLMTPGILSVAAHIRVESKLISTLYYREVAMRHPALAFSFLLAATLTAFAQQPPQPAPDFTKAQVKVQKLADDVYVLQSSGVQAGMGNIGVYAGEDGIVLVDSQLVELGPKIEAALKTISDKPVKYVLNTHWHGDHTGGNAYWGKTAVLIAQENVPQTMQKEPDRRITNLPISLPTITFSHNLSLHINGGELRAIYFGRAHTDGDVAVFFPGNSVVHMGDVFTNFDPPHYPALDADNDGTGGPEGEIASIEYVLAHASDDAKIIPGHGAPASKAELRKYLDVVKATTATVQDAIKQGKSLDEMKQEKILAQWQYLETPPIKTDVYLERLYKSLTSKNGGNAGGTGH